MTESRNFDLVKFVPLMRERIYTTNPHAKQFLVSWVSCHHDNVGLLLILEECNIPQQVNLPK